MEGSSFNPCHEVSLANWAAQKLVKGKAPKNATLIHSVMIRVGQSALTVLMAVLTVGDVAIQSGCGLGRLGFSGVHLLLYPVWGQACPLRMVKRAGEHGAFAAKSLVAVVATPFFAVYDPVSAVSCRQSLGLTVLPQGLLSRLTRNMLNLFAQAWSSPYRNPVLLSGALLVTGVVGQRYLAGSPAPLLKTEPIRVADPVLAPSSSAEIPPPKAPVELSDAAVPPAANAERVPAPIFETSPLEVNRRGMAVALPYVFRNDSCANCPVQSGSTPAVILLTISVLTSAVFVVCGLAFGHRRPRVRAAVLPAVAPSKAPASESAPKSASTSRRPSGHATLRDVAERTAAALAALPKSDREPPRQGSMRGERGLPSPQPDDDNGPGDFSTLVAVNKVKFVPTEDTSNSQEALAAVAKNEKLQAKQEALVAAGKQKDEKEEAFNRMWNGLQGERRLVSSLAYLDRLFQSISRGRSTAGWNLFDKVKRPWTLGSKKIKQAQDEGGLPTAADYALVRSRQNTADRAGVSVVRGRRLDSKRRMLETQKNQLQQRLSIASPASRADEKG